MPIFNSHVEFPGIPLKGKNKYRRLYHYTSFDSFVKIWLNKNLRFSLTETLNDINEAKWECRTCRKSQWPLLFALHDIKSSYKQISLTMDFDSYLRGCMSSMMWGYYADKRCGVCIELDFEKLKFSFDMIHRPVTYKKYVSKVISLDKDVVSIKTLKRFVKKHCKEIFFTKELGWKGENEYRIVSNNDDYLDISNAITCVYLTECDSQECLLVEKLVNGIVPVKCVKYKSSGPNKISIPMLVDPEAMRTDKKRCLEEPDYLIKARLIYEQNKNDENALMLMGSTD